MGLDEIGAERDLALAGGDILAVEELDQHRDVGGLDQIKDVFAREIERGADEANPIAPPQNAPIPGESGLWPMCPKP